MQAKYTDFLARDDAMGQPIFFPSISPTTKMGNFRIHFRGKMLDWKQNGGSEFAGFFIRLELRTYAKDRIDKSG